MLRFSLSLAFVFSLIAVGQAASSNEYQRVFSPFGITDLGGSDSFAETLISPSERGELESWLFRQDLYVGIADQKASKSLQRATGHFIIGTGRAVGAAGEYTSGLSLVTGPQGVLYGGALMIGGAVIGGAIEDYGAALLDEADSVVSARIAHFLHQKYGDIIRPDGTFDRDRLVEIGESELNEVLLSEEFRKEVDFDLILDLKTTQITDMLSLGLKDNALLLESVENIDERLNAVDKTLTDLRSLQKRTFASSVANGKLLGEVDQTVKNTEQVVAELATKGLPAKQVLALHRAKVLSVDEDTIRVLEAKSLADDFAKTGDLFATSAKTLDLLGADRELVAATQNFGNLLTTGGAFAAAVSLGEPTSIFKSGVSFLGSASSLFGSGSSGQGKALEAIFKELRALSKQIQKNHLEQMELLQEIGLKLEDIEFSMNRNFAELGFDVAGIQLDTRELLFDDVRVCERILDEFLLSETQELIRNRGASGLSIWFQSDGRNREYNRCLEGLTTRIRVASESDYSGILRADGRFLESNPVGLGNRRDEVREIELGILQPTVEFIQLYGSKVVSSRVDGLYNPMPTICEVASSYADSSAIVGCGATENEIWPKTRIPFSVSNPGQGSLLSSETAVLLSRYARYLAPWNAVLHENTSSSASRVLSTAEIRGMSKKTASRRTRHLRALSNAVDVLDLNLAQQHVLAGAPIVPWIANVLNEKIVPAYYEARVLKNPKRLNEMLRHQPNVRSALFPKCSTGHEVRDVMCIMEANSTLAQNALRYFFSVRLKRNGFDLNDWRRALRSPFSQSLSSLVGRDILFGDAVQNVNSSTFGVWNIELPRVHWDPSVDWIPRTEIEDLSCWSSNAVPLIDPDKKIEEYDYYSKQKSARCFLVDTFNRQNFVTMEYSPNYGSLLTERVMLVGLLENLCENNRFYPARYCSYFKHSADEENSLSSGSSNL